MGSSPGYLIKSFLFQEDFLICQLTNCSNLIILILLTGILEKYILWLFNQRNSSFFGAQSWKSEPGYFLCLPWLYNQNSFVEIPMKTKKDMYICTSYIFFKFIPNSISENPKLKSAIWEKISWYKRWPHYWANVLRFFCSFDDAHFSSE